MKVLVAGASGAIGKQLVPRLVAAGHSVTGMTRSTAGAEAVRALGGEPAIADALDPEPVAAFRGTLEAIRHLERAVTGAEWTTGIAEAVA